MNNDTRLGPHTLCCEYASVHRVPRAANASRFGVFAAGFPNAPTASARNWSGMNNTRLGRVTGGGHLSAWDASGA